MEKAHSYNVSPQAATDPERELPYVLSLAGLDPSGGAGLLADIKTFEALGAYGLGVCTALTVQTDNRFLSVEWQTAQQIIAQAQPLLERFPVDCCKIGIIRDLTVLQEVVQRLHELRPGLRIVLDPVLKASAGFVFHSSSSLHSLSGGWQTVLAQLQLLTPNYEEALLLTGLEDGEAAAHALLQYCPVLLKGGHRPGLTGTDVLYTAQQQLVIPPGMARTYAKHGSGCVLSAAITALLAKGHPLDEACINGKRYTEKFLSSHSSLLGYHYA